MCSAFPDWKRFAVPQRRPNSGCIPTGYEMLLRAAGAQSIDFAAFQDDFDLDQNRRSGEQPKNNFESVADAVREKYPNVNFRRVVFAAGEGADKLRFVEARIASNQPVLVSLALEGNGWHIMPVVDATTDELVFLKGMKSDGTAEICSLRKDKFVLIHNTYPGGDDVAYLEGHQSCITSHATDGASRRS